MVFFQRLPQVTPVKMCVYFCRCNALVPQHLLHRSQVCPCLYQVCGKGMPERMRVNIFPDTAFSYQVFEDYKHHHPRQLPSPPVKEEYILTALFYYRQVDTHIVFIELNMFDCLAAYRYQPFFISLTHYPNKTHIQVHIRHQQTCQFAYPQATAIHGFQHGAVAHALGLAMVYGCKQLFNLF